MNYYLLLNRDQQQGPLAKDQLLAAGMLPTSLVWHAGLPNWRRAEELPELVALFPLADLPPANPFDKELPPPIPDDLPPALPHSDTSPPFEEDSSDFPENWKQSRVAVQLKRASILLVVLAGILIVWDRMYIQRSSDSKPEVYTREGVKKALLGDWCLSTSIQTESFTFNPDGTYINRTADPRASRWGSQDAGHWEIKQSKFMDTRRSFFYIKAGINFFAFREGYPDVLIDIKFKGFHNTPLEEDQYGIALEEYKINMALSYDKYQKGGCGISEN